MKTGDLDRRMKEMFRPEPVSVGFARRMLRTAAAGERDAERLAGRLSIQASRVGITCVRPGTLVPVPAGPARRHADRARQELYEYLAGERAFFTVPIDLTGLPGFQRGVLETALEIPFGEVRPYAWIARRVRNPRAVRAVGTALGRNPVPLLVPCHRVLRSDGGMGGYRFGLRMKGLRLDLERRTPLLEGCSTTRILCRVGCPAARRARADHRIVFASVSDARSVGYRPCRTCRPRDRP